VWIGLRRLRRGTLASRDRPAPGHEPNRLGHEPNALGTEPKRPGHRSNGLRCSTQRTGLRPGCPETALPFADSKTQVGRVRKAGRSLCDPGPWPCALKAVSLGREGAGVDGGGAAAENHGVVSEKARPRLRSPLFTEECPRAGFDGSSIARPTVDADACQSDRFARTVSLAGSTCESVLGAPQRLRPMAAGC